MQTLPLSAREITAWVRLTSIQGLGFARVRDLLTAFGLPEVIFETPRAALADVVGDKLARCLLHSSVEEQERQKAQVRAILHWVSLPSHHWVTLSDPAYPPSLYSLADPPAAIYVEGNLTFLHTPAVAIVGSRHATAQGLAHAEQFGHALSSSGVSVISGLALGIDGAAHCGALSCMVQPGEKHSNEDNGRMQAPWGSTVAVMGTGIDQIYPTRHQALAQRIGIHGALISEYPLGTPARAHNFPRRNRLIAALSQAVLVVEAATQSGSLITARLAAELGRDVLAVPGSIHSPVSKGCHRLIKEGAKLVETIDDIMEELKITSAAHEVGARERYANTSAELLTKVKTSPPSTTKNLEQGKSLRLQSKPSELASLDAPSRSILEALGYDPAALDLLAERTHLSSAALQATLLQLELQGWVHTLPDGRVSRSV